MDQSTGAVSIAQVQVQNKLQLAQPPLPKEVQRQGISVTKSTVGVLLIMAFYSEDGSMKNARTAATISAATSRTR